MVERGREYYEAGIRNAIKSESKGAVGSRSITFELVKDKE
jgi:hypothetical protein